MPNLMARVWIELNAGAVPVANCAIASAALAGSDLSLMLPWLTRMAY
ncbi:MAG: hypothetical protein JO065_14130 [Acidobacteria bacterium]|nr:hypothetical protein [Acidobacteriota bacterium]